MNITVKASLVQEKGIKLTIRIKVNWQNQDVPNI